MYYNLKSTLPSSFEAFHQHQGTSPSREEEKSCNFTTRVASKTAPGLMVMGIESPVCYPVG